MQIPGYRIISKIAQGGMSTVYLAIQESVGRVVALKVMAPALNADPAFSERFQREANIVGQLSHPNIVSIYDIGRHDNYNYIAMDHLPGGSIHDRMLEGIEPAEALSILKEIASALDHAHQKGYIHRDIKPENVLFRDGGSAVLTDFGVARARNLSSRSTQAGTVVGTPHYMSPEQTRGKNVDARSDLYSLGIVFYEMLTGTLPYQGEEAVAIALKHLASPLPTLPSQFVRFQPILDKLLDKEPDKRYQSGGELVRDIDALQLQMREQDNAYFAQGDGLGRQFAALTQIALRKSLARIRQVAHDCWAYARSVRYTRQHGLHRLQRSGQSVDHRPTRQNTQINTRIHRSLSERVGFAWRSIPRRQRPIAIAASSVFVGALVLLVTVFSHPGGDSNRPDNAAGPEPSKRVMAATSSSSSESLAPTPPVVANAQQKSSSSNARSSSSASVSSAISSVGTSSSQSSAVSSSSASSPEPVRPRLTVTTQPADAQVRIMNIREKYHDDMDLPPGRYDVEVTHPGHREYRQWVRLKKTDLTHSVTLQSLGEPGDIIQQPLASGGDGPKMAVLSAGRYEMGGPAPDAAPKHMVTFDAPFAISQTEITFEQYERFARAESRPLPGDNRWGRDNRPVINVSWEEAQAYADWLSRQTGQTYRLPTEAEWEYAARAGTQTAFWWGNNARGAKGRANCRRYCGSEYTGFFSGKTAPVGQFEASPFKLYDTAGNVAEWVMDCYKDGYEGAPSDGSAVTNDGCNQRVIRGGSLKSDGDEVTVFNRRHHAPDSLHEDVGFRVVLELE